MALNDIADEFRTRNRSLHERLQRLIKTGFTAMDIAEPLICFDAEQDALKVQTILRPRRMEVAAVFDQGVVGGYVLQTQLIGGVCGDHLQPIGPDR
jgi:hypothetical protein